MTIVDLDVAPPPVGGRPRLVPARWPALLAVGLLTLLLVTGSARPAAQFAGGLWSAPYDRDDDTVTSTSTSLYLFHRAPGGSALRAYDLATGAVRWSAPAPDIVAQVPSVAGGVIVAPDGFERYFDRPDLVLARTTRTVARDARTGAALWRAAGAPADVTDRSVLLLDAAAGGPARLYRVGLHDGRTLWSRPVPGLSSVVVLGGAVVAAATDGRLTVLRYGDGTIARTKVVPWPDRSRLSVAAGRLVVTGQPPTGLTSSVYRADTLAELWRFGGPLTDCRAVLCGTDPSGLAGYDPDTGARRWRVAAMTLASPVSDDRIIASSELNGLFQLLDPATGGPIGPAATGLGSWRAEERSAGYGVPGESSAFVLRGVTETPDRTAVIRLDLRTGAQDVLGALDGSGWIGCRNVTKYLICRRNTRLTVTAAP